MHTAFEEIRCNTRAETGVRRRSQPALFTSMKNHRRDTIACRPFPRFLDHVPAIKARVRTAGHLFASSVFYPINVL